MFGVVKIADDNEVTQEAATEAAGKVCRCGQALVECVEKVINPVLAAGGVEAEMFVGVGVDVGDFVATRIGIEHAYDLTAYGECVDTACHRSDHGWNRVVVTNKVQRMFPTGKGGKTLFPAVPSQKDAYFLKYPPDYCVLK